MKCKCDKDMSAIYEDRIGTGRKETWWCPRCGRLVIHDEYFEYGVGILTKEHWMEPETVNKE